LFKVATRTDSVAQLSRLMEFFCLASKDMPVAAMGIGQFGAVSRLLFARCGSALIYTSLLSPRVDGQLSLQQFRAMTDASPFSLQR
jgi:3-dehydroquinate dehydratase